MLLPLKRDDIDYFDICEDILEVAREIKLEGDNYFNYVSKIILIMINHNSYLFSNFPVILCSFSFCSLY